LIREGDSTIQRKGIRFGQRSRLSALFAIILLPPYHNPRFLIIGMPSWQGWFPRMLLRRLGESSSPQSQRSLRLRRAVGVLYGQRDGSAAADASVLRPDSGKIPHEGPHWVFRRG